MLLIRLLLALALLVAGCAAGRSQFVPGEPSKDDALRLAAPAETLVVIHGSDEEFVPDPCDPAGGDSSEWSVPSVLSNLSGTRVAGKVLDLRAAPRIDALVFAFEGDPYEPPADLRDYIERGLQPAER